MGSDGHSRTTHEVAVFHPGTQHSLQTARALDRLGKLAFYATSIANRPDQFPYNLARLPGALGERIADEFTRFSIGDLDPEKVRTVGWHEWAERIARRAGREELAQLLDARGNRIFAKHLAKDITSRENLTLWGFDNSSRETFELEKEYDRACILDVTTPHMCSWNALDDRLRDQWPQWMPERTRRYDADAIARLDRELELADVVVTGSDACAASLVEHGPDNVRTKVQTLAYCYDDAFTNASALRAPHDVALPLKFLFVGQLSARKGLPVLLETMVQLPRKDAQFTLLGGLAAPRDVLAPYEHRFTHIPHVARSEVPAIMADHDVLVMPSYLEGSSIALLEALATGLAIIQTKAAGQGATKDCGIVIDQPDVDALVEAMRVPIVDRHRLISWQACARQEATRYSFDAYCENIEALLKELPA